MSFAEIQSLVFAAVQAIGAGAVFLLALFIGVCVGFGFPKLRPSGPKTRTVRSLEESLGKPNVYLSARAPHGPSDQLAGSQRVA